MSGGQGGALQTRGEEMGARRGGRIGPSRDVGALPCPPGTGRALVNGGACCSIPPNEIRLWERGPERALPQQQVVRKPATSKSKRALVFVALT